MEQRRHRHRMRRAIEAAGAPLGRLLRGLQARWLLVTLVMAMGCGTAEPMNTGSAKADAFAPSDTSIGKKDTAAIDAEDAAILPDIGTGVEEKPCQSTGSWGCTCEGNKDCDSGFCVESEAGKVCTRTCQDTCASGWKCSQAPGSDLIYVCLPTYTNQCKPCANHDECTTSGGKLGDNLCVPLIDGEGSINGSFCGTACGEKSDCKAGFDCTDVAIPGVEGTVKQCLPESGECGCLAGWVSAGLATSCEKSNEFGTCKASRLCTTEGLTPCTADVPGVEICDSLDNDCDGQTDEDDAADCVMFFSDADNDGFGIGNGMCLCDNPGKGFAAQGGDCNDLVTSVKPGADEICDNNDNNCNGQVDEAGAKGCQIFYKDKDGDKFGDNDDSACLCLSKKGPEWLAQGGDCNDANKLIKPGVTEVCSAAGKAGVDDNCNGKTDEEGSEGCKLFYIDADGDEYGQTANSKCLCGSNKLYATDKPGDCNDNEKKVSPVATEICNGVDDDCSGTTDDEPASSSCPVVAGGAAACLAGKCGVGKCGPGLFDVDGDLSNGCECQADSNYGLKGNTCGNYIELGEMPDGSNTVLGKGNLMPSEDGDWFHFLAKDMPDDNTCDQFHVRIKFSINPGSQFVFDVYRKSCAGGDQVCSGSTEHSWTTSFYGAQPTGSDAKPQQSSFGDHVKSPVPEKAGECKCMAPNAKQSGAAPGMNLCSDNSAHYFVRVYRKAGTKPGAVCLENSYAIQLNNSPP